MVLFHTRFALASIATLQVWTLANCSVIAKHLLRIYLGVFSRIAILSWSSKFAQYTPVIVLLLSKKSNIVTPFVSESTVVITLPADGCVLNFFGFGDLGPISFIPCLILMNPSLIYNHQTQKKFIF